MPTAKFQRFTNVRVLKTVRHERLLKFLSPHRDYIASRGLPLPREGEITDAAFDQLGDILKTPDHDTPGELLRSVHMVNELSRESTMEKLLHQIDELGSAFEGQERVRPADVAVEAILRHRDVAESFHRLQALHARRTYSYFQPITDDVPVINDSLERRRGSFENFVGDYFEAKRCGRGTEALMRVTDEAIDISVIRGLPWRIQDILVDGIRDILNFQPVHEDLLQFNRLTGELKINAGTTLQKEMYRAAFGQHFFDDEDMFPEGDIWTTEPLRIHGAIALSVADIPQLLSANLTSATLFVPGERPELVTTKRPELIDVLAERIAFYESQDMEVRIAEARIELRFVDGRRTRSVAIKPPNIAVYTRDGDADVIEEYLNARGFTSGRGVTPYELPEPVLASGGYDTATENVESALATEAVRRSRPR